MKKLTTLIVLVLMLTVGGVYAGWNYFQGGATGANANPRLGMATVSYDGEKGIITADTTSMSLLVDDMSTVAGSGVTKKFVAGLRGVGQIDINFTAKDGADADIVANGIKMQATITVSKVGQGRQYNGVDAISTVNDVSKTVITLNGGNASKTATISFQQIIDALVLCDNQEVILDTLEKNQNFADILSDYQIHVNIVEIA